MNINVLSGTARRIWSDFSNQRSFMDRLAKKLNITYPNDWYNVTNKVIKQHGGDGLLHKFNGSGTKLLAAIYPEYLKLYVIRSYNVIYKWDLSKFSCVPRGYWNHIENQRHFMDALATKLNIKDQEGWYSLTTKTMKSHGGHGLLHVKYNGSVTKLLTTVYPEYRNERVRMFT